MTKLHTILKQDYERSVAIPSDIFKDTIDLPFKERAMFVTYYYFITYLYLYGKYGEDLTLNTFKRDSISKFLKVNKNSTVLSKVARTQGLLDQLGYTYEINDPPTGFYFQDEDAIDYNHTFFSETTEHLKFEVPKKMKFKFPIKAYFKTEQDMIDRQETGTVVDPEKAIIISVETFHKFFKNNELNFQDFFIYLWIIYNSNKSKAVLAGVIAEENLNITKKRYYQSLKRLSDNGLISKFTTKQKDDPTRNTPLVIHVLQR